MPSRPPRNNSNAHHPKSRKADIGADENQSTTASSPWGTPGGKPQHQAGKSTNRRDGNAKANSKSNAGNKTRPVKTQASLHPRNRHQTRYDFDALVKANPDLQRFMVVTPAGNDSIDFTDPQAIKVLNRSLLMHWYGIKDWDIPDGYLCPPIPGRADYIHNLADLLANNNDGKVPLGQKVRALDVGCGANCIYPIIANSEYGWRVIAADIQADSLASAQRIVSSNPMLEACVDLRRQPNSAHCFSNILSSSEKVDLTLCNPPFHESAEQMARGNERKWKNLGKWDGKQQDPKQLNFGGQGNELWCDGGEVAFVSRMIRESRQFGDQVCWFTSLVSRQAAIPALKNILKEVGVVQQRVIEMSQGQKSSRFIAWSFLDGKQMSRWKQQRWG